MDNPPPYSNPVDPRQDRLPPYRVKHAFASPEEELAALKEFANSKLYVPPGYSGTLPSLNGGGAGLKGLVWGGPLAQCGGAVGESGWPAPETSEQRKIRREKEKETKKEERSRRESVGNRLKRVISGGSSKDEKESGSVDRRTSVA